MPLPCPQVPSHLPNFVSTPVVRSSCAPDLFDSVWSPPISSLLIALLYVSNAAPTGGGLVSGTRRRLHLFPEIPQHSLLSQNILLKRTPNFLPRSLSQNLFTPLFTPSWFWGNHHHPFALPPAASIMGIPFRRVLTAI